MKQIWHIDGTALVWEPAPGEIHRDSIEMSGLYCDSILGYGVKEDGTLSLTRQMYFPMLRTIPNDTHASFCFALPEEDGVRILADGAAVTEKPIRFTLDGTLTVDTETDGGITVRRQMFPSADRRFSVESVTVRAEREVRLSLSAPAETVHSYGRGTKGVYVCKILHTLPEGVSLAPGETAQFYVFYTAVIANEHLPLPDGAEELAKRQARVRQLCEESLILETGIPTLDTMLRFAKLRAGESIFDTLTGKYHSPGGGRYYAATWCNDQIEYAGPHFAMTGDSTAIEASLNAYRSYIPFMADNYAHIPSSVIAEGLDIWEGVGDRGDAAMYLYGASLFCLYCGDEEIARELYGAIRWCAEYCERQKAPEGVIRSDTDELEGRFPTDKYANLSTSALCYGGLRLAAKLARSLGDGDTAALFTARADRLAEAIEAYFGAGLHGFSTYRYSRGFDTLRAWICLPLCMGITARAAGTMDAMLSPYLWTEDGMLTCEFSDENRSRTVWDRSTLYGMKCAFLTGMGDRMMPFLLDYCTKRLLCDRVPYAVEAWPEGGKRHLSGESALFVRVVTEGLFGIVPESLTSFSFRAALPAGIPQMKLSAIRIAGGCFDIEITADTWTVTESGRVIARGKTDGGRVIIRNPY